jgi:hypothetical protein
VHATVIKKYDRELKRFQRIMAARGKPLVEQITIEVGARMSRTTEKLSTTLRRSGPPGAKTLNDLRNPRSTSLPPDVSSLQLLNSSGTSLPS